MTNTILDVSVQVKQAATKQEATKAMELIARFVSPAQLDAITYAMQGEEQAYFFQKVVDLAELITNMPSTYQTDGMGEEAVVFLHYFSGQFDWFITEKDMLHVQLQAFGLARMWEEELGYININELRENQAELDLYWTPVPLKDINQRGKK